MGRPRAPQPVILFCGLLFSEAVFSSRAGELLENEFGPLLFETATNDWHSGHYGAELGLPIRRKFLFFKELVDPGVLSRVKIETNRIESALSIDGGRKVNIDPGYVGLPKLVLASTKDHSHRIYIGDGIYAETTLLFSKRENSYKPHVKTYRDYADEDALRAFLEAREYLKGELLSLEDFEESPE